MGFVLEVGGLCGKNKLTLNRQGAVVVEGLACCRPA